MKPRDLVDDSDRRKEKVEFAKAFGDHLRKIRGSKGISQEKLSLNAGYYHTYVNKIERGYYSPSLHTVWRLAHSLKMSVADLLKDF